VEFVLGREAVAGLSDSDDIGREDLVATLKDVPPETLRIALDKALPSWEIIRESLKRGDRRKWHCEACDAVNPYPSELRADSEVHAEAVQSEPAQTESTPECSLELSETPAEGNLDWEFNNREEGRTALHVTASLGQKEATELLLNDGADVMAKDKLGRTCLHHAALYGSKEVIELLLAAGADVNAANDFGATALHSAASFGMTGTVELLVAAGAQVNVANNFGETPLQCATEKGHEEVAEFLRQHGGLENGISEEAPEEFHEDAREIAPPTHVEKPRSKRSQRKAARAAARVQGFVPSAS
jgi:hypothetical protein